MKYVSQLDILAFRSSDEELPRVLIVWLDRLPSFRTVILLCREKSLAADGGSSPEVREILRIAIRCLPHLGHRFGCAVSVQSPMGGDVPDQLRSWP